MEEYQRLGNFRGEANAHAELAIIHDGRNQPGPARSEYEQALEIYRRIGDEKGKALIYYNLMRMLWHVGDRDGAMAASRQSLRIREDIGDVVGQGKVLVWTAYFALDDNASDETLELFRKALRLNESAGSKSQHVYALKNYSDALRLRGELAAAGSACDQARAEAQTLGDRSLHMAVDMQCAQIALDRGDKDAALADFTRALATARELADDKSESAVENELAMIDIGSGNPAQACDRLQRVAGKSTAGEFVTGEATTQALLALCHAALNQTEQRDEAVRRARELRGRINARGEVIAVDIALASLQSSAAERDAAVNALHALAQDAENRHWLAYSLEAQLAALQLLEHPPVAHDAAELRRRLTLTAQQHGFGWVLTRLAAGPD